MLTRTGGALAIAVTMVLATTASAPASIPLGQIATTPPAVNCPSPPCYNPHQYDMVQPTVTSGSSYVVPGPGLITSWTTLASPGANPDPQLETLKIFRKVGEPSRYQAVAQDALRQLNPSAYNTFPVAIHVDAGDLIGLNEFNAPGFGFVAPGETYFFATDSNLPDGQSGDFDSGAGRRLNITAIFEPSNDFTVLDSQRNRKRGTATLKVKLPGGGQLSMRGGGVKELQRIVAAAGDVDLLVRAAGKRRRILSDTGKVKVKPQITFVPSGGSPSSETIQLKLKKNVRP